MSERDDEAAAFYEDPANREPAGPPRRRAGQGLVGNMASVRLPAEEAEELRWAARESGLSASELLRRGLKHVLPVIRADWYEAHKSDSEVWGEPVAVQAGPRKRLGVSYGVAFDGEDVLEIIQAANACGISVSAYLRQAGLAVAAAQRAGGTASCGHLSMSGVTSATCGQCGPMPVTLTVTAPVPKATA